MKLMNASVALDNYEASIHVMDIVCHPSSVTVLIGSERGWSRSERDCLRARGFLLAHLGPRPLRAETAMAAGLSMVIRRLGAPPEV